MAKQKDSQAPPKVVQVGNTNFILLFEEVMDWNPLDRAEIRKSVKETRQVDKAFPIVLWEERTRYDGDRKEETVLDGAGRCLAAAAEGLDFIPYVYKSFKTEEDARAWAEWMNLTRGHKERDEVTRRRQERIDRVAAARAKGESFRSIGAREGISQTQAKADADKAASSSGVNPPFTPEPPGGKTTGTDGKSYPATKPKILCGKCQRVGEVKDCPACEALRAEAAKKDKGKPGGKGGKPAAPPKNGKPLFDWRDFDQHFGPVMRGPDKIAAAYPGEKKSEDFKECERLLREFRKAWDKWRKRLVKG